MIPLSSGLICISKRHIYIQREYEVMFCFSPVLTFNSKDSGREGGGRPHSRLSAFRRAAIVKKKMRPDFIVMMGMWTGKVDLELVCT